MKRLLAWLLCLCILSALFGVCGTAFAAEAERKYGTDEDGPFGRYAEPVTVRVVKGIHSTEADRFSELEKITGETLYKNRWTDLFERELNIKIEYMWVVDESQYQQKFKLAEASGELPDVVNVKLADIQTMSEAGAICEDLRPYYDQYASDQFKASIDALGYGALESVSENGKMKAYPYARPNIHDNKYMFIREDWLEKVGKKAPTTIAELEDVLEAFVTQDPDGNGQNDTFGMAAENSLFYHFAPIFWAYGAYPDKTWLKAEDGSLVYGRIQPAMKDALRKLQQMYNQGFFDPEFPLKSEFQAKSTINANRVGIDFAGFWEIENLGPVISSVPGCKWNAYPLPSLEPGKPTVGAIGAGVTNGYVVNKNFEHPEAIIKMMNLAIRVCNDAPEIYVDAEVPTVWPLAPVYAPDPENDFRTYEAIRSVQDGKTKAEDLKPSIRVIYDELGASDKYMSMFGAKDNASVNLMIQAIQNGWVFGNQFFGAPTPTMVEREGTLEELTTTAFIKIITDNADVDETFDKFVADWKALGGDQITREVNEWFKTVQ
ncbi:MAG: extracellular solute-binding protein [Oscillospiraceae bacterium]|jgi:putative aldouronate transport system substrate-binding protein|nr:extracellular solute-binding protein [Oscillospiraceae bacterium]